MSDKKVMSLERVVDVAARAFGARKFTDVSINDISSEAHCSTSTIYSVFGSKENLFVEAVLHMHSMRTGAALTKLPSPDLRNILGFADARIWELTSPQRRSVMRAISASPELAKRLLDRLPDSRCGYQPAALGTEVAACMAAGDLREMQVNVVCYHVLALTAYEPILLGLLHEDAQKVDHAILLHRIFLPFVTIQGEKKLQRYISEEVEHTDYDIWHSEDQFAEDMNVR